MDDCVELSTCWPFNAVQVLALAQQGSYILIEASLAYDDCPGSTWKGQEVPAIGAGQFQHSVQ